MPKAESGEDNFACRLKGVALHSKKVLVALALAAVVALFFVFGIHDLLSFEAIKESQQQVEALFKDNPTAVAAGFAALYVGVVTLNLPGATILGLLAGAIFGTLAGTVIVSFSSSIGATLACMLSRYLLRGWVSRTFPRAVSVVDKGIAREGAFYLFSLRLIPVFPFFLINLVMGLTAIRLRTFYWVSQIGMLPGTFIYVNAGSELARLTSPAEIFSPRLLLAFALLGLFPLAAKKIMGWYRRRTESEHSVTVNGPAVSRQAGDKPADDLAAEERSPHDPISPNEDLGVQAKTVADGCTDCGTCVAQCPFLAKHGSPGTIAGRLLEGGLGADAFECSLCGLCGAVCPERIAPVGMYLAMRRRAVERNEVDLSRYAPLLNYEKRGHSSLFTWYPPKETKTVFFPGCALPGTRPNITWRFFQELRKSVPDLQMVLDCCHKPSHDLGRQAHFLERFGSIRDRLVQMGVEEVIVACPNCWRVFSEYGAPLKLTTAYQVLAEEGQEEGSAMSEPGSAVDRPIVIHDPCPVRHELGIHSSVRSLVSSKGLAIRETKNAGKRTLCCGEGGGVGFHNPAFADAWARRRKRQSGEDFIVTYCAGCTASLSRVATTCHIGEILFEPREALSGKSKVAKAPFTYLNRLLLKRRLKRRET
jgi:uncharacterized membrane protein YdjX (TVP38/TMEM64 family)/ferredoxin